MTTTTITPRLIRQRKATLRAMAAAPVFRIPACAHCGVRLADAAGNPRWEIVGRLTFVCLGGCTVLRAAKQRKAVLT